jgi:hypothetical protein|tara:strand:- start:549 stop:662 length:114 start_codon:yes stop_codon:yes gene_type:complete
MHEDLVSFMTGGKIIFVLGVGSSVAMAIFALMMFLRN